MKKGILLLASALFVLTGFAQDQKAKAILDKVSEKTKGYKTISVEFNMTITGADMPTVKENGKAYLKGDKYKVELVDQDIYCDGETITTHVKEDEECYTSSVEDSEDEMITPNNLMTIWEDGYKYKYIKETTFDGTPVHHINLFPKDPANSNFHTIILKIDKAKNEIVSAYIKGKDGTNMHYVLKNMKKDVEIPDSKFVFDRNKYPNVECYEE